MRPQATHVTIYEGEEWAPFPFRFKNHARVHAIRFSDGSEWDCVNGWRQHTIPPTAEGFYEWNRSEGPLPGPTAPTSTPSSAPSSESASRMASISSAHQEAILWEALKMWMSLPASYGWSLSVVHDQSNTSYEVNRPSAAAISTRGWDPNMDEEERAQKLRDLI